MEKQIEKRFKREVEKCGAIAVKFISPGMAGVPDRLVLLNGGRAIFAEIKAEGETLRPLQVKRAKQLRAKGFRVYCIDSDSAIDQFVSEVLRE